MTKEKILDCLELAVAKKHHALERYHSLYQTNPDKHRKELYMLISIIKRYEKNIKAFKDEILESCDKAYETGYHDAEIDMELEEFGRLE